MLFKKIRASHISIGGLIVLAYVSIFLIAAEVHFASSRFGIWCVANYLLVGSCAIPTFYWLMVFRVTGSKSVHSRYWLINEKTGKATRAPLGFYFRSFDGWFRRDGQILIFIPYWSMSHVVNARIRLGVSIVVPRIDPTHHMAETLYKLCRDLDAVRDKGRDEIEKACASYGGMVRLHILHDNE